MENKRNFVAESVLAILLICMLPAHTSATEDAFFGSVSYGKNVGLRFDYCGAVDFGKEMNDFLYAINFLDGVVTRMEEEGTIESSRTVVIRPYQGGCFQRTDSILRSAKACSIPEGGGEPSGSYPSSTLAPCYELSMTMRDREKTIDAAIAMLLSLPGSKLGSSERTVDIPSLEKKFAAKIRDLKSGISTEYLGKSPDGKQSTRMEFAMDSYKLILTGADGKEQTFPFKATDMIPKPIWSPSSRFLILFPEKKVLIYDTEQKTQAEYTYAKLQNGKSSEVASFNGSPGALMHPNRDVLLVRFYAYDHGSRWKYFLLDLPSNTVIQRKDVKSWIDDPWVYPDFSCAGQQPKTRTSCPTTTFTVYYGERGANNHWTYPACTYTIMKTTSVADTALHKLFRGPDGLSECQGDAIGSGDLQDNRKIFYQGITVYPTYKENGKTLKNVAVVRFSEEAKSYFVCENVFGNHPIENGTALEKTLLQFKTISEVRISINGLIVLPGCKMFPSSKTWFGPSK
jgi:hypothetical protein